MIAHMWRGVAMLAALLFLAGCYETDTPLIEDGDGVEIPNFAGTYQGGDKGDLVIEDRTEGLISKDYKYHLRGSDGVEYDILANVLADDLWHLQMARALGDGSGTYLHMFLVKQDGMYIFEVPDLMDENKTAEKVAQELGVAIQTERVKRGGKDEMRYRLDGSPDAARAFLKAHADRIKLNPLLPLMRK